MKQSKNIRGGWKRKLKRSMGVLGKSKCIVWVDDPRNPDQLMNVEMLAIGKTFKELAMRGLEAYIRRPPFYRHLPM